MPVPPPGQAPGKRDQVAAMFNRIAPRYDLLNRVLSAGIDQRWRRRAVALVTAEIEGAGRSPAEAVVLDVATGTADLAIAAARRSVGSVVGVDPAPAMLEIGRKKAARAGLGDVIELQVAASEKLPFDEGAFDGAMVAFGVRNFEDRHRGLAEIARVLRPGAPLVVLEFSRPRGVIAPFFGFYFHRILPRIGALVSGDRTAYSYLHDSVQVFPDGEAFLAELSEAQLEPVGHERLTFGIASLYVARKSPS